MNHFIDLIFLKIRKIFHKITTKKIFPGFWSNDVGKEEKLTKKYIFDLSDSRYVHFGDNLFFISAFLKLRHESDHIKVIPSQNFKKLWSLFNLEGLVIQPFEIEENDIIVTSFETALKNGLNKKTNMIYYDFTDTYIQKKLGIHILKFLNLPYEEGKEIKIDSSKERRIEGNYFIFNDIIYSRSLLRKAGFSAFRKKIIYLKKQGLKCIYVGSESDKKFKTPFLNFIDLDLRGEITFSDLLSLVYDDKCVCYLGFDNAIMHLHLMFKKETHIFFRGKFLNSQKKLHIRSINNAVLGENDIDLINYIS